MTITDPKDLSRDGVLMMKIRVNTADSGLCGLDCPHLFQVRVYCKDVEGTLWKCKMFGEPTLSNVAKPPLRHFDCISNEQVT